MLYLIGTNPMGPLKIGKAVHIYSRVEQFQRGCPLPLSIFAKGELNSKGQDYYLKTVSERPDHKKFSYGYLKEEQKHHRVFRRWCAHGEWFDISVIDFVCMIEGHPDLKHIEWRRGT